MLAAHCGQCLAAAGLHNHHLTKWFNHVKPLNHVELFNHRHGGAMAGLGAIIQLIYL